MFKITKAETKRRERLDNRLFERNMLLLIDRHNDMNLPCEICYRPETQGKCFESDKKEFICNYCYWVKP